MNVRIEKDTMGTIEVPADHLWGAQTQRSFENFKIGDEKMPVALIIAFAELKKAASVANYQLGKLSSKTSSNCDSV